MTTKKKQLMLGLNINGSHGMPIKSNTYTQITLWNLCEKIQRQKQWEEKMDLTIKQRNAGSEGYIASI